MVTPKLIGIYGHAGVGKDTAANFLCRNFQNTYAEAFAKPLKNVCAEAFGIPVLNFYGPPEVKEEKNTFWNLSPREIAQYIGSEMFRAGQEDFWIKRLEMRLEGLYIPEDEGEYTAEDTVIITDVRFTNEAQFIKKNGGVLLHIKREGYEGNVGLPNHVSEKGIATTFEGNAWLIQNNGSIQELYTELMKFAIYAELNPIT